MEEIIDKIQQYAKNGRPFVVSEEWERENNIAYQFLSSLESCGFQVTLRMNITGLNAGVEFIDITYQGEKGISEKEVRASIYKELNRIFVYEGGEELYVNGNDGQKISFNLNVHSNKSKSSDYKLLAIFARSLIKEEEDEVCVSVVTRKITTYHQTKTGKRQKDRDEYNPSYWYEYQIIPILKNDEAMKNFMIESKKSEEEQDNVLSKIVQFKKQKSSAVAIAQISSAINSPKINTTDDMTTLLG